MKPFIAKFPIYAASFLPRESILILAGGGGPSRSGLQNGCLIVLVNTRNAQLQLIGELSTGEETIMASDIFPANSKKNIVALSVNDRCWLTELSLTSSDNHITSASLSLVRSIQADFSATDDGYLRFVRFNKDPAAPTLLVGGSEGKAREWTVPELRLLRTIEQGIHEGAGPNELELVDGDVFYSAEHKVSLVAIASKTVLFVKNRTEPIQAIQSPILNYTFRHVRFLPGSKPGCCSLLAVLNPERKGNKPSTRPVVVLYCPRSGKIVQKPQRLPFARNVTAIAVSQSRVSFGFADGSLVVWACKRDFANEPCVDCNNLYLRVKEAHPFPVTSIVDAESLLISASADGVVLTHIFPEKPIPQGYSLITSFLLILFILVVLPLALALLANQNKLLLRLAKYIASLWKRRDELAEFDAFYDAVLNVNFGFNRDEQDEIL